MRRSALVLSVVATLAVILLGVLQGILIAVALSILLFFRRSWWPHGEVLGRVPELDGWHNTDRYPDAQEVAGVVIFRWEAPLFFANAGIFREQIRELVRHRRPEWIVLQCEAVTDVDVTAADMLEDLDNELNDQGVHLAFVELRGRIQDLLHRYGMFANPGSQSYLPDDRDGAGRDSTRERGLRPGTGRSVPGRSPRAPGGFPSSRVSGRPASNRVRAEEAARGPGPV